jgi:hypothetical protein
VALAKAAVIVDVRRDALRRDCGLDVKQWLRLKQEFERPASVTVDGFTVAAIPGGEELKLLAVREVVVSALQGPMEEANKIMREVNEEKKKKASEKKTKRAAAGKPNESDFTGTTRGAVIVGAGSVGDVRAGLEEVQRGQEQTAAEKDTKAGSKDDKQMAELAEARRRIHKGSTVRKTDMQAVVVAASRHVLLMELSKGWKKNLKSVSDQFKIVTSLLSSEDFTVEGIESGEGPPFLDWESLGLVVDDYDTDSDGEEAYGAADEEGGDDGEVNNDEEGEKGSEDEKEDDDEEGEEGSEADDEGSDDDDVDDEESDGDCDEDGDEEKEQEKRETKRKVSQAAKIARMTLPELKCALGATGMHKYGSKADLVARLNAPGSLYWSSVDSDVSDEDEGEEVNARVSTRKRKPSFKAAADEKRRNGKQAKGQLS